MRERVMTEPKELVRIELKNAGFDIDSMEVPKRVYLLADDIYDAMIEKGCGEYKYPLGGKLYVMKNNSQVGFIKGKMCSPGIALKRGKHWTTDAGYHETWGQVLDYRSKGALCVEMEGVGLFTIAQYRNCSASAIYIITDVITEEGWHLGWEGDEIAKVISKIIDAIS